MIYRPSAMWVVQFQAAGKAQQLNSKQEIEVRGAEKWHVADYRRLNIAEVF